MNHRTGEEEARTAAQTYQERRNKVRYYLVGLEKKLEKHEAEFKASGKKDWGYPGDLGYAISLLEQAFNAMGGEK